MFDQQPGTTPAFTQATHCASAIPRTTRALLTACTMLQFGFHHGMCGSMTAVVTNDWCLCPKATGRLADRHALGRRFTCGSSSAGVQRALTRFLFVYYFIILASFASFSSFLISSSISFKPSFQKFGSEVSMPMSLKMLYGLFELPACKNFFTDSMYL